MLKQESDEMAGTTCQACHGSGVIAHCDGAMYIGQAVKFCECEAGLQRWSAVLNAKAEAEEARSTLPGSLRASR